MDELNFERRAAKMIGVSFTHAVQIGCGRATCAAHGERIFCASTT
jgi:hypothetical protein